MSDIYDRFAEHVKNLQVTGDEELSEIADKMIAEMRHDWVEEPWVGKAIDWSLRDLRFLLAETNHQLNDEQKEILEEIVRIVNARQ